MKISHSRRRETSQTEGASWSPLRLLKTALMAGAALQTGGYLGYGFSDWQHARHDGGGALDRALPGVQPLEPYSLHPRRMLRPQAPAPQLQPQPQPQQTLAERYAHDRRFRRAMDEQQVLLASAMAPGTKSIAELAHTVVKPPPRIGPEDRVVLFAMFTQDGKLSDHAAYYIDCLQSSFDHVIGVVATDSPFHQVDTRALSARLSGLVLRENHGLDFAGWSLLMRLCPEVWSSKQLLFTNDSLFGPLRRDRWDQTVSRIDGSDKDFIGLVESFSGLDPAEEGDSSTVAWHYQSYFFALKNAALRSPEVQSYWFEHIYSLADKADIIRDYEVGMTVQMRAYGMKTEALFSTIKDRPLDNPSIGAAKPLLDRGFNFIKREFWRNPAVLPFIEPIDLEEAARGYPVGLPALPWGRSAPVAPSAHEHPEVSRLTLRYAACDSGLSNQVYAHLSALTLGHAMQAEVELSDGRTRSSFADYNTDVQNPDPALRPVAWSPVPLSDLLDVKQLAATAGHHGLHVRAHGPAEASDAVVEVPDRAIPQRQQTLDQAVEEIFEQAADFVVAQPIPVTSLTISMPCPLLWVADLWKDPLAVDLARTLKLPAFTTSLAQQAIAAMGGRFNGIHLRMEEDATGAIAASGGEAVYWESYVNASRDARFDARAPIYLSSGLLSYGNHAVVDRITAELRGLGYRGNILHKERLFPGEQLDALSPESQAVLDLAVMSAADKVVGARWSSFSVLLQQLRELRGRGPGATLLAGVLGHPDGYFRLAP